MRATEVKGCGVHPADSEELTGTVTDLVLDVGERRIVSLLVQRDDKTLYSLSVGDIQRVGEDIETMRDAALIPLDDSTRPDGLPSFNSMVEEKAMTESGTVIGKLSDLEIDERTWNVTAYAVVTSTLEALEHGERCLPADQLVSAGAHMLLVSDSAAEG